AANRSDAQIKGSGDLFELAALADHRRDLGLAARQAKGVGERSLVDANRRRQLLEEDRDAGCAAPHRRRGPRRWNRAQHKRRTQRWPFEEEPAAFAVAMAIADHAILRGGQRRNRLAQTPRLGPRRRGKARLLDGEAIAFGEDVLCALVEIARTSRRV